METSEHFERALFYDRSPNARSHYESSARQVFEEALRETHIEVRVKSCSRFGKPTVDKPLQSQDSVGERRYSGGLDPKIRIDNQSDLEKSLRPEAVRAGGYPSVNERTKPSSFPSESTVADLEDVLLVSKRASSPALPPIIDQSEGSSGPPLYPGRPTLTVLQLAQADIEGFVHQTENDFRVFFLRQVHSYDRLLVTKGAFESLLDSCNVFPRFTEYVTGLGRKRSESEVGPPPLKFRLLRPAQDEMYHGFGMRKSASD